MLPISPKMRKFYYSPTSKIIKHISLFLFSFLIPLFFDGEYLINSLILFSILWGYETFQMFLKYLKLKYYN